MLPVLKAAAAGEVRFRDLVERLAEDFHLTDDEKAQRNPSGQSTLNNRAGWAKTYLTKAGLLETTRRGYFQATERGQVVLRENPESIDTNFLSQFPEFEQFRRADQENAPTSTEPIELLESPSSRTPDELLQAAHQEIEKALRVDLLDRLLHVSSAFFENTIVTLLVTMGYGGSREGAGRAIGRSGDNGIDGVIDQDALGLDRVYIQAKLWKLDRAVGEPEIRDFAGSLQGKKATKGVFVTTSYFTAQASAFAERIPARIVLIDGQQLANLMIKHDVGVRIEETLHLKKIDEDFFLSD